MATITTATPDIYSAAVNNLAEIPAGGDPLQYWDDEKVHQVRVFLLGLHGWARGVPIGETTNGHYVALASGSAAAVAPAGGMRLANDAGALLMSYDGGAYAPLPGGGGGMTFGSPVTIGTANAAGASTDAARANHVHDHGAQSVTTHHALASGGGAGFMSSGDYSKLAGITAGAAVASVTAANSTITIAGSASDPTVALNLAATNTWVNQQIFSGGLKIETNAWQYFGTDVILKRGAAATLQMGVDAATPIAQTLRGSGGVGTNVAGASLALAAGPGTGSGLSGDILFQFGQPGAPGGTTPNALTTFLRLTSPTGGDGASGNAVLLPEEDAGTDSGARIGNGARRFRAGHFVDIYGTLRSFTYVSLVGELAAADTGNDVEIRSRYVRTAGNLLSVVNFSTAKAAVTFDGRLQVDAGTALLPSLSFLADPNTGWWNSGADEMSASLGGAARVKFSNTRVSVAWGSAAHNSDYDHEMVKWGNCVHRVQGLTNVGQAAFIAQADDVSASLSMICYGSAWGTTNSSSFLGVTRDQVSEIRAYLTPLLIGTLGTTEMRLGTNAIARIKLGTDAEAASTTAFYLSVNSVLQRVSVGAADSGGTGYRQLRIPN